MDFLFRPSVLLPRTSPYNLLAALRISYIDVQKLNRLLAELIVVFLFQKQTPVVVFMELHSKFVCIYTSRPIAILYAMFAKTT